MEVFGVANSVHASPWLRIVLIVQIEHQVPERTPLIGIFAGVHWGVSDQENIELEENVSDQTILNLSP